MADQVWDASTNTGYTTVTNYVSDVTIKTVSDQLTVVRTVPRTIELVSRDHATVKGVGRMNHADTVAIKNHLKASGFWACRIRDTSTKHSWGVRVKKRQPVPVEEAVISHG